MKNKANPIYYDPHINIAIARARVSLLHHIAEGNNENLLFSQLMDILDSLELQLSRANYNSNVYNNINSIINIATAREMLVSWDIIYRSAENFITGYNIYHSINHESQGYNTTNSFAVNRLAISSDEVADNISDQRTDNSFDTDTETQSSNENSWWQNLRDFFSFIGFFISNGSDDFIIPGGMPKYDDHDNDGIA